MKEGFSYKTLSSFSDKQLKVLSEKVTYLPKGTDPEKAEDTANKMGGPVIVADEKDIETDTFAIQKFAHQKIAELPTATKRLVNPDRYPVFLTKNLADLQQKLISEYRNI